MIKRILHLIREEEHVFQKELAEDDVYLEEDDSSKHDILFKIIFLNEFILDFYYQ